MNAPAVLMDGVTKVYPGGVHALRGVSLRIEHGESVAVIGPSGSGKSTMLHLLGTLDRPSSGRVDLLGVDVAGLPDRRLSALRAQAIGFVFQQFHLAPGVRVLDNVADGLLYSGLRQRERRRRARIALERVGLEHRLRHRPHELSGGERQRVAIARAVVGEPPLLLADEPTGNLDTASGTTVLDVLLGLNQAGTTLILISHDRDVAARLDRQVRMRDGHLVDDTGPRPPAGPAGTAPGAARPVQGEDRASHHGGPDREENGPPTEAVGGNPAGRRPIDPSEARHRRPGESAEAAWFESGQEWEVTL